MGTICSGLHSALQLAVHSALHLATEPRGEGGSLPTQKRGLSWENTVPRGRQRGDFDGLLPGGPTCFRPCTWPCSDCVAESTMWCSPGLMHGQVQGRMQGGPYLHCAPAGPCSGPCCQGCTGSVARPGQATGLNAAARCARIQGCTRPRGLPCTRSRVHCRADCRAECIGTPRAGCRARPGLGSATRANRRHFSKSRSTPHPNPQSSPVLGTGLTAGHSAGLNRPIS